MHLPKDPVSHAEHIAEACAYAGDKLSKHGEAISFWIQLLRIMVTVVGALSLVASQTSLGRQVFGPEADSLLTLVTSVTLVVSSILFLMLGKNPPERFSDYSRYVLGYSKRIQEVLANDTIDPTVKKLRLIELCQLANVNLQDVQSQWSWALPPDAK